MKPLLRLIAVMLLPITGVAGQDASLLEQGQKVVARAFGLLSQNLMREMTAGGPAKALPFCNENAGDLAGKVSNDTGTVVQRVSHKPRNPVNQADAAERKMIEDYARQIKGGESVKARTVKGTDGADVFYAPIVMTMDVCLKCHGAPGTEIAMEDMDRIRALYPQDAATGFKLGEVRGLWKITFKKP